MEMEYEDDVFYEEIRKQILILTADDEEEGNNYIGEPRRIKPCTRGATRLMGGFASGLQHGGSYFSWWESENKGQEAEIVPAWLVKLWRNGSGTGVFIPQIVKSRRRYRPGRKIDDKNRSRMYSQVPARTSSFSALST